MKKNSKNSQFSSFLLRSGYAILVKICKWLKLLNTVPFIKKRLLNHAYIRISSSSLTFTVSQGMMANIKISQFSRFLLRSDYAIQVKISKWLKLLNSVPFIKKPLVNQVCIWILFFLTDFHSFTVNEERLQKLSIYNFSAEVRLCDFRQNWKFFILFHSSRNGFRIIFIFECDHLDWLSQFHREWRQTSKLVHFQDFC